MAETNETRTAARKRLEERRGFIPHLVMYLAVNAGLIFIWSTADPDSFFWPVFPLLFWGGGLVVHAWSAYFSRPITDADVDREVHRFDPPADKPDLDR